MSGICGIVRFDGKPVKPEEIQKMLHAIPNRGHDTEGILVDGGAGFGHRMLWTTPESLHENQPLVSKDGNLIVTADARLDNRDELFEKLGIREKDSAVVTDIDLILLSYQKWGEDYPKHLTGDIAGAIWDKKEDKLVTVRDRFAVKPLYFCFFDKNLYFSSYMEVLLDFLPSARSVSLNAIKSFGKFATINYEHTMYQDIFRIPPAYLFIFSADGLARQRYWSPENIKINRHISLAEATDKVKALLDDAVRSRLRIYGNLGCELSGGLDSTAIALIATQLKQERIKTFSMRFRSYTCDEWEYTKEAIIALNSQSVCLDVDKLDFQNKYNMKLSSQYSRTWPAYGSFMQNYVLGQAMVDQGIRVCFTGHGGDHIFTGLSRAWIEYIKNFQFTTLFKELSYTPKAYSKLTTLIIRRLRNLIIRALIPQAVKKIIKSFRSPKSSFNVERPEEFTDYWKLSAQKNKLRPDLYAIVGRQHVMNIDNSYYRALEMNYKIEFRHPFFDTRLVEYVLSLPNQHKYSCGTIKVILREVMKGLYPEKIYKRDDKAEFSEALLAQMASLDMQDLWKKSTLINRKLIDENLLTELLSQYEQKIISAEGVGKLWRLTTLAIWYKAQKNIS